MPIELVPSTPAVDQGQEPGTRTIFFRPPVGTPDTTATAAVIDDPPSAVRAFEAAAAPFVVDSARLAQAGRCRSVEAASADSGGGHGGAGLLERLTLTLPPGVPADTQSRVILVRRGPSLDAGEVVIPTAIVRVRSPGSPVEAEIVAQFGVVACTDAVLPLELPAAPDVRSSAVQNGPTGQVLWVSGEVLLPSLQHFVIVDLGSEMGVRPGDQVTLYSSGRPDTPAAVASVVRTSPHASTAVIIDVSRTHIAAGSRAQVTAKLP